MSERRMTDEQIDCCRRIGRDEENRRTTIGLAEIDALCAEAVLRGKERDELRAEVEQVKTFAHSHADMMADLWGKERDHLRADLAAVTKERDELRSTALRDQWPPLTNGWEQTLSRTEKERDAARAEVDRLRTENLMVRGISAERDRLHMDLLRQIDKVNELRKQLEKEIESRKSWRTHVDGYAALAQSTITALYKIEDERDHYRDALQELVDDKESDPGTRLWAKMVLENTP